MVEALIRYRCRVMIAVAMTDWGRRRRIPAAWVRRDEVKIVVWWLGWKDWKSES